MGFAAGLIIMVTCFTGAILVFEHELQHAFNKKRYYVTETGSRVTADSIIKNVKSTLPGIKISGIKLYTDPERTAEVNAMQSAPKKEIKKGEKPAEGTRLVAFVNPYSGEVIEVYNHRKSFFYFVMDLHRWMLAGDTGKMIVGICTLIFLFIIITGIILWWPRNRAILKQRLKIKTDAGFKRLNHDYHVVLGFYSAIFLFIFAFTGLAWSFEWFNKGIYTVTNSSMERFKAPKSKGEDEKGRITTELVLQSVVQKANNVRFYNIAFPKDSTDSYSVTVLPTDAPHESATDSYYVNSFTGFVNGSQAFSERNLGQRVRATFKPVHIGSVYGLPSKIIGLLVCLLGTFFPLSGYIMWWNRTRKKRNTP